LFLKAEPHSTGTTSFEIVTRRNAARRSSAVISSSPTYFSITVSSKFDSTSIRSWRPASAASARWAGISSSDHFSPMPSSQMSAFMEHRSTTPWKALSEPIGSCTTAGSASRRSRIICTARGKSAPTRSILLTKQIRGTWYLLAWRQTVSVWGSTPATASKTATAPSRTRRDLSTSTVKST
jgi:hypothetical protein